MWALSEICQRYLHMLPKWYLKSSFPGLFGMHAPVTPFQGPRATGCLTIVSKNVSFATSADCHVHTVPVPAPLALQLRQCHTKTGVLY